MLTEEEKSVKLLTRKKFAHLVQMIMTKPKEDLEQFLAGPNIPFEEELFIRHVLALGDNPNFMAYDKYLDRRIGKVKDELELTAKPKRTVIHRQDGSQVELATRFIDPDEEGENE